MTKKQMQKIREAKKLLADVSFQSERFDEIVAYIVHRTCSVLDFVIDEYEGDEASKKAVKP